MSKRMIIPGAALLLTFGLMCAANVQTARGLNALAPGTAAAETRSQAGPTPQAGVDCSDGKKVAKAIYAHFKRKGLTKEQRDRVNVFFDPATKVVQLQGFVVPRDQRPSRKMEGVNRVGRLAGEATLCETSVDNQLTSFSGGNCTPPRVPCGETGICLPESECNLPAKRR